MSKETDIAQLDRQQKAIQIHVTLGKALERLQSNRDFQKLIMEGYLEGEAVRLVHAKAAPNMQTPAIQAAIARDIDSIGALDQFFYTVMQRAAQATKEIETIEATRAELLAEGEAE